MTETTRLPECWLWEKGLPEELCDIALRDPAWGNKREGTVLGDGVSETDHLHIRDSSIVFLPVNHWLEGVLYNAGLYAVEQAGWGLSVGRPETVQLTEYTPGQHYDKHIDTDFFLPNQSIRKVSVVLLLSDPQEFEGGEFTFDDPDVSVPMVKGSVLAFPSLCPHQVKPVTAGVRRSAVCWIRGPR